MEVFILLIPKIVVITGPTATGKTRLGVELALKLGGEVVSADSMQIYRHMDIGTAKPSPEETRGVRHHMIDIAEPSDGWSVARWLEAAVGVCDDIIARGKLPILVGGTGLYIDSLISGRTFAGGGEDQAACRQELNERYDELGGAAMLKELSQFDPERAARLHAADKKRVVRAWEVFLLTGETITAHDLRTQALPPRYAAAVIALEYADRQDLYTRIDSRVDEMLSSGLFDEVRDLLSGGLHEDCTAMQGIGYKEVAAAIRDEISAAEAVERIKRESRRYAKRQLTWLRNREEVFWIRWGSVPDFDEALRNSTKFLQGLSIV